MANHYTQFSTSFRVGPGNVEAALALYEQMQAELGDHDHIGFDAERDGSDTETVWLWEGGDGVADIENVIAYAFRCAAAFDLTGSWGFHWSLTCSSPRKGAFGGGAQMLDLGRRESLGWMDCEHWVTARTDADGPCRVPAEKILASAADTGGWTEAKQLRALLGFIDSLTAADPAVADQLRSHLADVSAEPDDMPCREGRRAGVHRRQRTSHHAGRGPDGIDYGRDRDHTAIAGDGCKPWKIMSAGRTRATRVGIPKQQSNCAA